MISFDLKYDPNTTSSKLIQFANDIIKKSDGKLTTNKDLSKYSLLLEDNRKITHVKGATINKCIAKCQACNFKRIANKRFFNNKQKDDIRNHINVYHNRVDIRFIWDYDKIDKHNK